MLFCEVFTLFCPLGGAELETNQASWYCVSTNSMKSSYISHSGINTHWHRSLKRSLAWFDWSLFEKHDRARPQVTAAGHVQLSMESISQTLRKVEGHTGSQLKFVCEHVHVCVVCAYLPEHVPPPPLCVLSDCTSCLRLASCVSLPWMWTTRLPSRNSTTFTAAVNLSWMGEEN